MAHLAARDIALILVTMLIWGLNYVFAKISILEVPPFALLTVRFAAVGLLLVRFVPFPRHHIAPLLGFSFIFGTCHFGLVYFGLVEVPAATSAILVQLQVPFSAVLAFLFLGERATVTWMAGALLAFVGMILILGEPEVTGSPFHAFLVVLSALMWAISYLQLKRILRRGPLGFLCITAWMSLFSAPQMAVLSLLFEQQQVGQFLAMSALGWSAVVYQIVFVGIIAYAIWYRMIAQYPVNKISPFTLLIPVISAIAGVTILGDPVTLQFILGGLLSILGVGIITVRPRSGSRA